jgi:roadblock/LC7 domain-containing protein
VRGAKTSVCSVGSLVCFIDNAEASLNEVMSDMTEVSRY